jgi:outer membrane protein insertion porin family/translocation and assembly module TamA
VCLRRRNDGAIGPGAIAPRRSRLRRGVARGHGRSSHRATVVPRRGESQPRADPGAIHVSRSSAVCRADPRFLPQREMVPTLLLDCAPMFPGSLGSRSRRRETTAVVGFGVATLVLGGCKTIPEGHSSVNEITIRGAHKVDDGDIGDKIATKETTKFLMLFRGIFFEYSLFDRFVLQRDLARVEAFYRSKGYYGVHARAGRVFEIDAKHVRIEIIVEEGDAVLVREVHVNGLDGLPPVVVAAARSEAARGLLTNQPFEAETFQKTEGLVRRALTERGYAFAKVTRDAAVDLVLHKTDIVFDVTPGPKCVFGKVTIEGFGKLPEAPIRRTVDLEEGAPYSQRVLDDTQQALLDLGVFASAEVVPDLSGEPHTPAHGAAVVVPIQVRLELSRLRGVRLGGGLEFDSLKTDAHGLVGWEHRNLFGGLRSFTVTFRPGVVLYPTRAGELVAPKKPLLEERLRLEFKQPGFPEARTNLVVRPELNIYPVLINPNPPDDAPVIGYGELKNAVGLERTLWKLYGSFSHNTQIAYPFSYVGRDDPTLSTIIISYPELYTAFDFRDNKVHPRRGIFLANTLQVAGHAFGGNAQDLKVQPEVRVYVPVSRKTVFAARATVGLLWPQNYGSVVQADSNQLMPPSVERTRDYQLTFFRGFFSGGPNSNRGYPIRAVGPYGVVPFLTPDVAQVGVNSECNTQCRTPTGGFTLWELSAELRHSVKGPLAVAFFCDASDVSPETNDIRLNHPHLSCGSGVRYDTPAGPIRLDAGLRIPGLQVIGGLSPDEQAPPKIAGIPMAIAIGIGEAY